MKASLMTKTGLDLEEAYAAHQDVFTVLCGLVNTDRPAVPKEIKPWTEKKLKEFKKLKSTDAAVQELLTEVIAELELFAAEAVVS